MNIQNDTEMEDRMIANLKDNFKVKVHNLQTITLEDEIRKGVIELQNILDGITHIRKSLGLKG